MPRCAPIASVWSERTRSSSGCAQSRISSSTSRWLGRTSNSSSVPPLSQPQPTSLPPSCQRRASDSPCGMLAAHQAIWPYVQPVSGHSSCVSPRIASRSGRSSSAPTTAVNHAGAGSDPRRVSPSQRKPSNRRVGPGVRPRDMARPANPGVRPRTRRQRTRPVEPGSAPALRMILRQSLPSPFDQGAEMRHAFMSIEKGFATYSEGMTRGDERTEPWDPGARRRR